ncbi:hypothetical protein AB0H00_29660 [Nocardia sp. NPDC023852]|uniref:hypothetical protein n=1 Tax=Nocardia sp. NPDC023852 TaxID=3154697 RepID=UPI0033C31A36
MTTTRATDTAGRIMEHLAAHPLPDVAVTGWYDATPHPADASLGFAVGDTATEASEPEYRDYAVVELNVGRLLLNAEDGPLRWWLEVRRENEYGFDVPVPAGEGVLNGDIAPVIDAIRVATSPTSG